MEIISEPGFREVKYVDFDFLFTSGTTKSFSLKMDEGDSFRRQDQMMETDHFLLQTVSPKETIVVFIRGLAGYSTRERVMRYPIPPTGQESASLPGLADQ